MALRDFKVLTFDVVGTLIDFEGGMLAYLRQAAPGHAVTDDAFLGAYRAARKQHGTGWYPDDLERCWHVVAQALHLPDSDALACGLRDSVAQWPAFPDSVAAQALQAGHHDQCPVVGAGAFRQDAGLALRPAAELR